MFRLTRPFALLPMLLALALAAGSSSLVAAQETTPAVGDPVTIYSEGGDEVATITITEFADPFEDYDQEFFEPGRGTRIVALQIEVEVTGEDAIDVSDFDIVFQDQVGLLWGSAFVPLPDDTDLVEFEGDNLAPGDTASGVIGYGVPNDAELHRVFYAPSGRIFLLADLTGDGAGAGDDGADATADVDDTDTGVNDAETQTEDEDAATEEATDEAGDDDEDATPDA